MRDRTLRKRSLRKSGVRRIELFAHMHELAERRSLVKLEVCRAECAEKLQRLEDLDRKKARCVKAALGNRGKRSAVSAAELRHEMSFSFSAHLAGQQFAERAAELAEEYRTHLKSQEGLESSVREARECLRHCRGLSRSIRKYALAARNHLEEVGLAEVYTLKR